MLNHLHHFLFSVAKKIVILQIKIQCMQYINLATFIFMGFLNLLYLAKQQKTVA